MGLKDCYDGLQPKTTSPKHISRQCTSEVNNVFFFWLEFLFKEAMEIVTH